MSEQSVLSAPPEDPTGRVLWRVSRYCAMAGGFMLAISAALTTLSITLNALFKAPIHGEYELVGFGTSLALYLFLPYCQMVRGNVVVDFFLSGASPRLREGFDALGALLYFLISALLAWRMSVGGLELFDQRQATAVLHIPYWWSFPIILPCLMLLTAVTIYSVVTSIRRAVA